MKDLINSPRTIESFKRLGVEITDLDPMAEWQVKEMLMQRDRKRDIPQVLINMRMEHNKEKRIQLIDTVKQVCLYH